MGVFVAVGTDENQWIPVLYVSIIIDVFAVLNISAEVFLTTVSTHTGMSPCKPQCAGWKVKLLVLMSKSTFLNELRCWRDGAISLYNPAAFWI